MTATNERYKLNKELAQMLKGGVIMDVTHRNRPTSQRKLVPVPLWHWSGFLQTSVQPAAFPV